MLTRSAAAIAAAILVVVQLLPGPAHAAPPADPRAEYEMLVAQLKAQRSSVQDEGRDARVPRIGPVRSVGSVALKDPEHEKNLAETRYAELAGQLALGSGLPQVAPRLANWPHRGPISSPFAPRWGGFHNGLDIAAPFFTPVYAAAGGVVTVVGRPYAVSSDLAVTVSIAHGGNFATVYVHLDDRRPPVVKVGQRVSAGQLIAYVGSTGWSTGPHTHFMTILNGRAVDPLGHLPP